MESPSDRLDKAMEGRRLDLGLSWNDVAVAAKVSIATLRAIRRGTNQPSQLTKRRIDEALRWASGSVDALMTGGDPKPIEQDNDDLSRDQMLARAEALMAEANEYLRRARGDSS